MQWIGRTFRLRWVLLLFMAAPLAACRPREVTQIRYLTFAPIHTQFNPGELVYEADFFLTTHLWSPLAYIGPDGEMASDLASEWKHTPSALEWEFKLRPGLKWSDGSPMTAEQIAASLTSSLRKSKNAALNGNTRSVEAENAEWVRIRLEKADPGFVAELGYGELSIRYSPDDVDLLHLGRVSGPYRVQRISEQRVELEPNPFFRPDQTRRPLPVLFAGATPIEEAIAHLESGEADIIRVLGDFVDDTTSARLRAKGIQELREANENWVSLLAFGPRGQKRIPSFARRVLMKSLSLAAQSAKAAGGDPAYGVVPPYRTGALPTEAWRNALTQLPDRLSSPIQLELFVMRQFQASHAYRVALETLKRMPGLQINPVVYDPALPSSNAWKRRQEGDYDLLFVELGVNDPDPDLTWREVFMLIDKQIPAAEEAELARAHAEPDTLRRAKAYQDLEYRNLANPLVIPLRRVGSSFCIQPSLKPPRSGPLDYMLKFWMLEPT